MRNRDTSNHDALLQLTDAEIEEVTGGEVAAVSAAIAADAAATFGGGDWSSVGNQLAAEAYWQEISCKAY